MRQNIIMRFRGLILLVFAAAILAVFPVQAFADYRIPSVRTVAQIQTDGSLHVVEQRAFCPDEAYSLMKWNFTGLPGDAEISVNSLRLAPISSDGSLIGEWFTLPEEAFQSSWRLLLDGTMALSEESLEAIADDVMQNDTKQMVLPTEAVWSLDERSRALYVFGDMSSDYLLECDYSVENAVFIYDDVAEFYWDYISPNADAEMENVAVTVQLPVPDGIGVAPGQNVLAWGHGPAGTVDVTTAGTVEYSVHHALKNQYAQAHIIFPQSWLNNIPRELKIANSGVRKDKAIAEEGHWTDTWSNQRMNYLIVQIVLTAICFIVLLVGSVLFALFGRNENRLEMQDPDDRGALFKLFSVSPAIVGRVHRWNRKSMDDFVSSLIGLSYDGAVRITSTHAVCKNSCTQEGGYPDISISVTPRVKDLVTSEVDRQTLRVLFDVFGEGYQSLTWKDILSFAKRYPDRFADAFEEWQAVLSTTVCEMKLFDNATTAVRKILFWIAAASVLIAVASWLAFHTLYAVCIFLAAAVALVVMANYTYRRTEAGNEIEYGIHILGKSMRESETTGAILGESLSNQAVAYIVASGFTENFDAHQIELTYMQKLWLSPVRGYGEKQGDCFAMYVSRTLFDYMKAARK